MKTSFQITLTIIIVIYSIIASNLLFAQGHKVKKANRRIAESEVIRYWSGTTSKMTINELAAYCAPIFWFSPDEPELENRRGKDIKIPANFPFEEEGESPVVYYQIRKLVLLPEKESPAFYPDSSNWGESVVDLSKIVGIDLDYNHYYRFEAGLGGHDHDTEQAQFKILVHHNKRNPDETLYELILIHVTAKAHALSWYDNIYKLDSLSTDFELNLPFHILVEEGKHASCTDMNGDGYYTPGYDVNVRTNDAWGLRDVIRTGELFSPEFRGWMAKVRRAEFKVLPPLPFDSPLRYKYMNDSTYAPENAVYELRPMPSYKKALPDRLLAKDMKGYYVEDWPAKKEITSIQKFFDWWESENFIKSISVAFRANKSTGISLSFPLLIVKNIEAPLIGGWLVHRIYFQDHDWRDFGWGILYTPSASRFMDPYFAFGLEIDKYDVPGQEKLGKQTDFVFETGIKIRANVKYSPLKFLSTITDFWGVRLGIMNKGFWDINKFTYVFEIGAGVW